MIKTKLIKSFYQRRELTKSIKGRITGQFSSMANEWIFVTETSKRREQLRQAVHIGEDGPYTNGQAVYDEPRSDGIHGLLILESRIHPAHIMRSNAVNRSRKKMKKKNKKNASLESHFRRCVSVSVSSLPYILFPGKSPELYMIYIYIYKHTLPLSYLAPL